MTSIAAAWMNIVYGFLGLKSDRSVISVAPKLPSRWNRYAVNLCYRNRKIKISVTAQEVRFSLVGEPIEIGVYDKPTLIKDNLVINR